MTLEAVFMEMAREASAEASRAAGMTVDAYEARERARSADAAAAYSTERVERQAVESRARAAFGEALGLRVPATVAVAVRVSGLSARLTGDGRNALTVQHIQVCAEWTNGRRARRAGEFLCRAWRPWDISDYGVDAEVTCDKCRSIAAKAAATTAATTTDR